MKANKQNANEGFTSADANRISFLVEQRFNDSIFWRMLVDALTDAPVAEGKVAYMPGSCIVTHVGGDRATGVQLQIGVGIGFKYLGTLQTDPDRAKFVPIVVSAAEPITTAVSDVTNPRIDLILLRQREVSANPKTVFVIDPPTQNVTSQSLNKDFVTSFEALYVPGTPAASPVAPSVPSGWTTDEIIAEITIAPGSGAFNPNGNLVDKRKLLELAAGLVPSITSFPANQVTVAAPLGDANAQEALARISAAAAVAALAGSRNATFEHVNTTSVRLAEGPGGDVRVEIDGTVVSSSGALTFTLPAHLDTGTEAASTWYYCYVRNIGGVLTPVISVQPPLRADGTKVGYHPTITDARFVQAFYNDNQSNIVPFDEDPDRTVWLRSTAAGNAQSFFTDSIGTSAQNTAYLSRSLGTRVPVGAKWVRLVAAVHANDTQFLYARASLAGQSPTSFPSPNRLGDAVAGGTNDYLASLGPMQIPIADPATPAYAWATEQQGGTPNIFTHRVHVAGWRF